MSLPTQLLSASECIIKGPPPLTFCKLYQFLPLHDKQNENHFLQSLHTFLTPQADRS
ncbi:hypothetical protein HOLleu_44484 [Holothuria leucospilota]|uniref:Uncharacterized protein n=1 Tax=Holothuria leucospilota TaxID=206669 RepID=A0A9Q1BAF8_HOLLE|nr:hypothetical protein HOLleu_44484 [Holothuria leucospilota]